MNRALQTFLRQGLFPNDVWQLCDLMKSVLRCQIYRLPKREVSETDTRYPEKPEEIRAFLVKFFTRHYFQTQNSLIDYIISPDFLNILKSERLRILDIGSGPAVSYLAITDLVAHIVEHLQHIGKWPGRKALRITYVLNDTSGICLGTGQNMLAHYFRISGNRKRAIACDRIITIQNAFPRNLNQLRRIRRNLGEYDIATLSYVLVPLNDAFERTDLVRGLLNIENICSESGRILILQDKFQKSLIQRISRAIGTSSNKKTLKQDVYPRRNSCEVHTYWYYHCIYSPTKSCGGRTVASA